MKTFAMNGYRLRSASVEVRLVYSAFLGLVTIGLLTMAMFQLYHIGPTPGRVAAYYRGGERAGELTFPKTLRELVEVTHFHSFTMGLVYLVLAHLFIATPVPPSRKRALITLGAAGLAGEVVADEEHVAAADEAEGHDAGAHVGRRDELDRAVRHPVAVGPAPEGGLLNSHGVPRMARRHGRRDDGGGEAEFDVSAHAPACPARHRSSGIVTCRKSPANATRAISPAAGMRDASANTGT